MAALTYNKFITVEGEVFEIDSRVSGVYHEMIKQMIKELVGFTYHYSKCFFMRFDLHVNEYSESNSVISKFLKTFTRKIFAHYRLNKMCFIWCREISSSDAQHYHFMIGLDGHKVKHSQKIYHILEGIWKVKMGNFWQPDNCFYFSNTKSSSYEEVIRSVIYRASYLAKVRSKFDTRRKGKMYGRSRLPELKKVVVTFR